jgi:hypothetical protein
MEGTGDRLQECRCLDRLRRYQGAQCGVLQVKVFQVKILLDTALDMALQVKVLQVRVFQVKVLLDMALQVRVFQVKVLLDMALQVKVLQIKVLQYL